MINNIRCVIYVLTRIPCILHMMIIRMEPQQPPEHPPEEEIPVPPEQGPPDANQAFRNLQEDNDVLFIHNLALRDRLGVMQQSETSMMQMMMSYQQQLRRTTQLLEEATGIVAARRPDPNPPVIVEQNPEPWVEIQIDVDEEVMADDEPGNRVNPGRERRVLPPRVMGNGHIASMYPEDSDTEQ